MPSLEYLLDISPGAPSVAFLPFHWVLLASLVGALLSRLRGVSSSSPIAKGITILLGIAAALVGARILGVPYLSTRLAVYAVSGLALLAWGGSMLQRGWIERQLNTLTLTWPEPREPLPRPALNWLLVVHGLGLAVLAAHYQAPYGWILLLGLLLVSPLVLASLRARKPLPYLEATTPLFFAYLVVVLRRIAVVALPSLGPDLAAASGLVRGVLSVEAALLAAGAYTILIEVYILCTLYTERPWARIWKTLGMVLVAATLVWTSAAYANQVTHGVTASDPYAYAQMAIDLVKRGTPLHRFQLFGEIYELGIPWWPVVHVGYHLPSNAQGDAATVWPFGGSILLAVGYLVGGEPGLYWTTPIIAVLSAAALFALVYELWIDASPGVRTWAGAWGAFFLLTSYEQIDRSVVPMADASAQLFTILTVLLALQAQRARPRLYGALAGLAWGGAYFVRHTQGVLGLSVLVAAGLVGRSRTWRERWEFLYPFAAAAFVVALPDLIYHQTIFGNFLALESEELKHYSLAHIPAVSQRIIEQLLAANEFGYLLPLLALGFYSMARRAPRTLIVLLSWMAVILVVHLPYEALRLRDLLSIFPATIALAVEGTVALGRFATQTGGRRVVLALTSLLLLFWLPALRTRVTLGKPWGERGASFGWMGAPQRSAFDQLAELTPPGSVIGASLNSGPIDLYAGRATFRPAFWSERELDVFVEAMWKRGRSVYILDDSSETAQVLERARDRYRLIRIIALEVPLFGEQERASRGLYRLEPD